MNAREQLLQYTEYNKWANERMCGFVSPLSAEQMHRQVNSSFDSIAKTIFHIYAAESIWFARLNGESPDHFPNVDLSDETLCDDWLKASQELINWVIGHQEQLSSDLDFMDTKGNRYTLPISGVIMHVCNHGTYHRGQLITLLRQVGQTELDSTDLITYLREN